MAVLVSLDPFYEIHGTPAVVTVPGGAPVATRVVRVSRPPAELTLGDGSVVMRERWDEFRVRLDHVPKAPRGTVIEAEGKVWQVDAEFPLYPDESSVRVVEVTQS